MTLRECLNNHMYQKAKIGAESGFLFCDKITEETIDILTPIGHVSRTCLEKEIKALNKAIQEQEKYNQPTKDLKAKLEKTEKKLENWTEMPDRKVLTMYRDDDDSIIIIINGSESGKYWTFEEYAEDKKKDISQIMDEE